MPTICDERRGGLYLPLHKREEGLCHAYRSLSSRFSTLPIALRGSSSTTRIALNRWVLPTLALQSARTASASAPFVSTTNATGVSPHSSLGMPTTAASTPRSSASNIPSRLLGKIFNPPEIIMKSEERRVGNECVIRLDSWSCT